METKGFHTRSAERAKKAGVKFRSAEETVKDTLAWFRTLPAERRAKLRAGLAPERAAEVLAAWRKQTSTPQPKKR